MSSNKGPIMKILTLKQGSPNNYNREKGEFISILSKCKHQVENINVQVSWSVRRRTYLERQVVKSIVGWTEGAVFKYQSGDTIGLDLTESP